MDSRFKQCLDEKRLVKIGIQPDLVKKELDAAGYDLKRAETSISAHDAKWASVQAYYSMFHTAKALVLGKGYREKSHLCLAVALKALFVDESILEAKHYTRFRDCQSLREDADYGLIYSESSANEMLKWASEFLAEAKKLMATRKP